jgi:hypothetical protein
MIFIDLPNPSGYTRSWDLLSLEQNSVPEAEKCFWGVKQRLARKADRIIRIIKSRRMMWVGNVSQMGRR